MNLRIIISLIVCLTVGIPTSLAQTRKAKSNGIFGSYKNQIKEKKSNTFYKKKAGLYAPKYLETLTVSISANQFYGDISSTVTPADLFTTTDMSAYASAYYRAFFCNALAYRAGGSIGGLSGARTNGSYFKSLYIEPSITLHCHPFYKNKWAKGLNIFVGAGVMARIMLKQPTNNPQNSFGVIPLIPIGIGYEAFITDKIAIGIELSMKQALMDNGIFNMDNNYPFEGEDNTLPGDGYYSIGITGSYKL